MENKNPSICVVFGGYGSERDISINTGRNIARHLDRSRFRVLSADLGRESWQASDDDGPLSLSDESFRFSRGGESWRPDLVYNAIHGTPGEDGRLQGYFDLLGIPYTGSGVLASALTFHKLHAKLFVAACGYQTAPWLLCRPGDRPEYHALVERLSERMVVKPCSNGSTIGVSVVHKAEELEPALASAFDAGSEVLIERYVAGDEYTLGVFRHAGRLICTPLLRRKDAFEYCFVDSSKVNKMEFVPDHDPVVPLARRFCEALYGELDLGGVVRFDFIRERSSGKLYFLEVNTVPGMSEISILTQQIAEMGWSMTAFLSAVVDDAMRTIPTGVRMTGAR